MLHLLARKGEDNAATLQMLLGLRLAGGSAKVYHSGTRNSHRATPIHVAANNDRFHGRVIQMLVQDDPGCLEVKAVDGLPVHYACQFSRWEHAKYSSESRLKPPNNTIETGNLG